MSNHKIFVREQAMLTSSDVFNVLFKDQYMPLNKDVLSGVEDSNVFLAEYIKNNLVYGVNTGFGPMAQFVISDKQRKELQLNLIRSHASGSGEMIEPQFVRATLLARLNTLSQGYSGVSYQTLAILQDFINHEIYPVIYEHGGVGASGDLIQLAHVALSMIGEGEVWYKDEVVPTTVAMNLCGIEPLRITIREGLALINGTSSMNGIGFVNFFHGRNLVDWMIRLSSLMYEVFSVFDDFFSKELNACKKHPGQNYVADKIRGQLQGSRRIKKREADAYTYVSKTNELEWKMQEYYSLRCTPQILGPIYDALCNCEKVLVDEINSVNDNPVIDLSHKQVLHGGNFHGDYISFEMDKIKLGIIKLSILSERQTNYLFNHKLNKTLPPFLNRGILGLNLGLQATQFPATSTTSESMTLGSSNYINNISTNNDNQDVVSMGTNAALITNKVIKNTYEVLAVQYQAVMNAVDYLKIREDLSERSSELFKEAENVMAFSDGTDKPYYEQLKNIKMHLMNLT